MVKRMLKATLPRMKGDDVSEFQTRVTQLGYDCGEIDGVYGTKTIAACKAYQKARGLTVDGICGPKTWAALLLEPLEKDYTQLLIDWGFRGSLHSIGEDATIRQFQAAMGLSVDGIVGNQTRTALSGRIIKPRINEDDIICQCTVAKANPYCNGYPRGKGAGQGVMLLAERIFLEVEKNYPGVRFYVTSARHPAPSGIAGGYRCGKWNAERGGASGSQHKACFALDVYGKCEGIKDSVIRQRIEDVAMKMNTKGGVGYGAAFIVHIDTRGTAARWKY